MRIRTRALLLLSVVLAASGASAQTAPSGGAPSGSGAASAPIDPEVRALFGFRARTGKTPLAYIKSERFEVDGVAPVVVRFASAPTAAKLAKLTSLGIEAL